MGKSKRFRVNYGFLAAMIFVLVIDTAIVVLVRAAIIATLASR